MMPTPTLYMFCGKIAAGKSTMAAQMAATGDTILVSEDDWLAALFSDQMSTPRDFAQCSEKLRSAMGPHIAALLNAGLSVVLDFQANTPESRAWMRNIVEATDAENQLHVLLPPDSVCLARLKERNASGTHRFSISEEQFHHVSRYFTQPTAEEGLNLIFHN